MIIRLAALGGFFIRSSRGGLVLAIAGLIGLGVSCTAGKIHPKVVFGV